MSENRSPNIVKSGSATRTYCFSEVDAEEAMRELSAWRADVGAFVYVRSTLDGKHSLIAGSRNDMVCLVDWLQRVKPRYWSAAFDAAGLAVMEMKTQERERRSAAARKAAANRRAKQTSKRESEILELQNMFRAAQSGGTDAGGAR